MLIGHYWQVHQRGNGEIRKWSFIKTARAFFTNSNMKPNKQTILVCQLDLKTCVCVLVTIMSSFRDFKGYTMYLPHEVRNKITSLHVYPCYSGKSYIYFGAWIDSLVNLTLKFGEFESAVVDNQNFRKLKSEHKISYIAHFPFTLGRDRNGCMAKKFRVVVSVPQDVVISAFPVACDSGCHQCDPTVQTPKCSVLHISEKCKYVLKSESFTVFCNRVLKKYGISEIIYIFKFYKD